MNSVEAFDPDTGAWQAMPPLLRAHLKPKAVVYDRKLIACGGGDDMYHNV